MRGGNKLRNTVVRTINAFLLEIAFEVKAHRGAEFDGQLMIVRGGININATNLALKLQQEATILVLRLGFVLMCVLPTVLKGHQITS